MIVAADNVRHRHPVTSQAVLIGWLGWRSGARALGCVATVLLAVVGCTTVTDGTPGADTAIAPAYRASVSASVSASVATSSKRESQRQQSLTTQAVVRVCESFVTSSKEAVDRVNDFVAAYNRGGDTSGVEGPAVDALNHSADTVEGDTNGPLSSSCARRSMRTTTRPATWRRPSARTPGPTSSIRGSISSTTPRPKPSSVAERPYESTDVERYVLCDDKRHRTAR